MKPISATASTISRPTSLTRTRKKVRKPKEEWIRVENTHEALVSKDVFDRVQELIETRRRKQKDGTTQIFSGLVKCADCGWSLALA